MAVEELNECFRAGGQARVAGKEVWENPHRFDTPQHESWSEGWWDMDEHLKDRDEALASIGWFR